MGKKYGPQGDRRPGCHTIKGSLAKKSLDVLVTLYNCPNLLFQISGVNQHANI